MSGPTSWRCNGPGCQSAALAAPGVLENDFLRVEVDIPSGAIRHLIDKATGYDYAPEGRLMAFLEMCREVPHAMTSWDIGAFDEAIPLLSGWQMVDEASAQDNLDGDSLGMVVSRRVSATGPHRAAIRVLRRRGDSRISIETALSAGSPTVEITLHIRWREIGTPETGVPNLRMALPVNIQNARAAYEIPFGHITRDLPGQEVPALRWADLTGSRTGGQEECGLTLLNDGKHGHSASGDTLRLTLLRSSYDPDPLPEIGSHTIRLKLCPHAGPLKVWEADRAASAFNQPPAVVTTDIHAGPLPPLKSFAETLTPNIVLAAIKRAEDTGQVLLRLYETEGADTEARIRLTGLARPGAAAVECDLLERPLSRSAARMEGDILYVPVSAFGLASVLIGEAR